MNPSPALRSIPAIRHVVLSWWQVVPFFGANVLTAATAPIAKATLTQLSLPAKAPESPPPGYNILFVLVDQEHFFDKWPFPVPGREYLKQNGTTFLNHQAASQVCSSARSVIYTGHTSNIRASSTTWRLPGSPICPPR
jgi:hypothetical protein